jgi:hypothetical protein
VIINFLKISDNKNNDILIKNIKNSSMKNIPNEIFCTFKNKQSKLVTANSAIKTHYIMEKVTKI